MSRPWSSPLFALGASAFLCIGVITATVCIVMAEEEEENRLVSALEIIPRTMVDLRKRGASPVDNNLLPVKRRLVFWDRQRAEQGINEDYLGPSPIFSLDDFKRMFRVSGVMYNEIRTLLCAADPFFRDGFYAPNNKKIPV